MKKFKGLQWVANHPVESITFVFSVTLVISALWIVGPWYIPSADSPIQAAFVRRVVEVSVGGILLICGLPGTIAPFSTKPLGKLKVGTMLVFLCFFFLALLRLLIFGLLPLTWLPILMIALASGILRLHLGTRLE
jgi:hypothetical protein